MLKRARKVAKHLKTTGGKLSVAVASISDMRCVACRAWGRHPPACSARSSTFRHVPPRPSTPLHVPPRSTTFLPAPAQLRRQPMVADRVRVLSLTPPPLLPRSPTHRAPPRSYELSDYGLETKSAASDILMAIRESDDWSSPKYSGAEFFDHPDRSAAFSEKSLSTFANAYIAGAAAACAASGPFDDCRHRVCRVCTTQHLPTTPAQLCRPSSASARSSDKRGPSHACPPASSAA